MIAKRWETVMVVSLASAGLLLMVAWNFLFVALNEQYAWLAAAFLDGRLGIDAQTVLRHGFVDMAAAPGGLFYWPLGPLPALALMPVVALLGVQPGLQAALQACLGVLMFAVAFMLSRHVGFTRTDAAWHAVAFMFGSVAIGVVMVNTPWQLAGGMSAVLLLLAVLESIKKDRPLVVGTLVGLATASRFTAVLGIAFFIVRELAAGRPRAPLARRLALLLAPIAIAGMALGAYNYARFGAWSDTGLAAHTLAAGAERDRRADGGFRLQNVQRNFIHYFLKLPELHAGMPVVSPYGVSVFLLSPAFLFLVRADRRSSTFAAAIAATAPALAVFMTYFTTGYVQFGPRYLLDILPFWYLVLLETFRRTGFGAAHKAVIGASVTANAVLFIVFTAFVILTQVPFGPVGCSDNLPLLCSS